MKHIKLFENWAEELEMPLELDPNYKEMSSNIWGNETQMKIKNRSDLELNNISFTSFSNYDFWNDYYNLIYIDQRHCDYRLEDCIGIPETGKLQLTSNNIKSLKGLENRNFNRLVISECPIENLKYCPKSDTTYNFSTTSILSYYGCNINFIESLNSPCGKFYNIMSGCDLDLESHSNIFAKFKKYTMDSYLHIEFNPWAQCYYDPNDVENFDFLFSPFWYASEQFREKAQEYLSDIDLGKLNKEELW